MSTTKSPRYYINDIVALPIREERRQALNEVPECFREMVRKHVELYFLRKAKAAKADDERR